MEKKEYKKTKINVIAIDAVRIMAGSETIPIGVPGSEYQPEPDEDGYIYAEYERGCPANGQPLL